MKKLIVAIVVLGLLGFVAPARAEPPPNVRGIIEDCHDNGQVDGDWTLSQLTEAQRALDIYPELEPEREPCAGPIRVARHRALGEPTARIIADCEDNDQLDGAHVWRELSDTHWLLFGQPEWRRCQEMVGRATFAAIGSAADVIRDCELNGRVEGEYSVDALSDAVAHFPRILSEFSACEGRLRQELDRARPAPAVRVSALGRSTATRLARRLSNRRAGKSTSVQAAIRTGRNAFYIQTRWDSGERKCFGEVVVKRGRRTTASLRGSDCR